MGFAPKNCPNCGMPLIEVKHHIIQHYRFNDDTGSYTLQGIIPDRTNVCPRCEHDLKGILKTDIRVEQAPSRFKFGLRMIGETTYRDNYEVVSHNRLRAKAEAIEYFQEKYPDLEIAPLTVELIGEEGNA